jgi:2-furoyl-CoA dehydrogenase FAD binding subunit
VKPAPFSYVRPQGLQHALEALAADPGAKVLAGGQSLVPLLNMRLAAPSTLVDINALPGLDGVLVHSDGVHIGALARHADVLASPEVRRVQPLVSLALAHVAHATIRNRGTTVGSIVHADAAAEMPMVLVLLGGSVTVASSTTGRRTIAAGDLFAGPMESTLRHDEIALRASFPALRPGEGVAFEELARRHGDYALCGVGAVVRLDGDRVVEARTGYLSVSDVPTVVDVSAPLVEEGALRPSPDQGEDNRSPLVEEGALRPSRDQALDAAADLALARLDPADDIHATAAYRTQLVRVLTRRVLRAAYDDALARSSAGATP